MIRLRQASRPPAARWRLFRLLGIPIYLDITWVVILLLLTGGLIDQFKNQIEGLSVYEYVGMALVTAIAFFASIVLHELGHALVARSTGMPIRGITLFIFGGVAEIGDEPPSAGAEFIMAIAGPAVSVVLGGLFLLIYYLGSTAGWPAPALLVFQWLGWINLLLVAFNLVPAFPLDGGRVLRSILWGATGNLRKATYWSSLLGRGFAWLLILVGVLRVILAHDLGGLWWMLIGWFVNNAARSSYRQVLLRHALGGEPVRRFMNAQPITVPPDTSLRHFVEDYVYRYHRKAFPVAADGRLDGYVTTQVLSRVPREEWDMHTVGEVTERDLKPVSIAPDADAMKALARMQRTGLSRLLVIDGEQLVGIVSLKDLLRFLQLKLELEGDGGDEPRPRPPLRDARRGSETPTANT
jgi:Zn-dependent protease/CBS domain-containing protein